jgi:cellulose synthase/poly-beta-1,6-N-acetylglucosamine synthase-like glycosyltransferase
MLQRLVESSTAEWVAFVDAGSVWEQELLVRIHELMADPSVIAVAPSYMPLKAGLLERMNWKLEQTLKSAENGAGGPISIHGASIFYRRTALVAALDELAAQSWLNDDIAIPLTLRLKFPESRIVYFAQGQKRSWVSDVGVRSELDVEYRRRRRMVLGNLQWIKGVLLERIRSGRITLKNVPAVLIALRRVLRLFWAYWVLSAGVGTLLLLLPFIQSAAGLIGAALIVLMFGMSNWIRRVGMAFVSGLQIPQYWRELGNKRGVTWS